MSLIVDILSWLALSAGGLFYLIGAIGLNRMPDVFSRMHAVSVSETLGVGLLVLGMLLQAGFTLVSVKLLFIVLALWTASAVSTHALARAALHDGETPLLADQSGRMARTDLAALFPDMRERLATPLASETVVESGADEPRPATEPGRQRPLPDAGGA